MDSSEVVWHIWRHIFPAAFSLLPGKMDTPQARAQVLAIGFQESDFVARQQGGTRRKAGQGPAKGFWQFEKAGGCPELLEPGLAVYTLTACAALGYPNPTAADLHEAIEHNDVLALIGARLLLYKDPRTMPESTQVDKGWQIYVARWRPGAVTEGGRRAVEARERWTGSFHRAWEILRA